MTCRHDGVISAEGHQIKNLADPTDENDANKDKLLQEIFDGIDNDWFFRKSRRL